MISLTVLRLSYTFWRQTLAISKRLSGPTWLALALLNASIAISAFSLYRAEEVSESAIPPVYYAELPFPDPNSAPIVLLESSVPVAVAIDNSLTVAIDNSSSPPRLRVGSLIKPLGFYFIHKRTVRSYSPSYPEFWILTRPEERGWDCVNYTSNLIVGWQWTSYAHLAIASNGKLPATDWKLPRLPSSTDRLVIQAVSDAPSLLTPVQQVVAILVGIVTTMLAILNTFMAWQVYRRSKAQEILLQLQIAKLQCEMAEMKARDEQARSEARESSLVTLS